MLGQVFSLYGDKYNVVILAGGAGTRMGEQSDYICKALTPLGGRRAIDFIIERYNNVAHKFIIGTGYHADLLKSYILGNYNSNKFVFSHEKPNEIKNNAYSFMYCLDYCDVRYPTIVLFCDLLLLGNFNIEKNSFMLATPKTKGQIGTFRHTYNFSENWFYYDENNPVKPTEEDLGVMGNFVFGDTYYLKKITYNTPFKDLKDITNDVVIPYHKDIYMKGVCCEKVIEFGTEADIQTARELWEKTI